VPRPHRIKLDGTAGSIESSIKVIHDDIYNLSASIKAQLNKQPSIDQIIQLFEIQGKLIDKRIEVVNFQKFLYQNPSSTDSNTQIPVRMMDGKLPDNWLPPHDLVKKYYIYLHINEHDNTVFYIGKGSGNRAADANSRSDIWKRHVLDIDYKYRIEIHQDNLTQDEATRLEDKLILDYYPLGCLVNQLTSKQRAKINVLK
jgi:hypothetical protein